MLERGADVSFEGTSGFLAKRKPNFSRFRAAPEKKD